MTLAQNKDAEIAADGALTEWLPGELDRYLDHSVMPSKRRVLERLALDTLRDKAILDAGCGPGTFGVILGRANTVLGLDISWRSVRLAVERAREANASFRGIVGDLEFLPFQDAGFDVCLCGWVLHHFRDIEPVIGELNRVLRPGGELVLVEPNEGSLAVRLSRLFEDRFRGLVLTAGVDVVNRQIHSPTYYYSVLSRHGFWDICLGSCYSREVPVVAYKKRRSLGFLGAAAVRGFLAVRHLIYVAGEALLPPPFNGSELLITARKSQVVGGQ